MFYLVKECIFKCEQHQNIIVLFDKVGWFLEQSRKKHVNKLKDHQVYGSMFYYLFHNVNASYKSNNSWTVGEDI